jgi:small subunit ribosomal protein S17e
MGRIKTKQIKRLSNLFVKMHGPELTDNYDKNKEVVAKYASIKSKKLKNAIVGYATRLKKTMD